MAMNGWFWGQHTTGSGQYTMQLLQALRRQGGDNRFFLALRPDARERPDELPAGVQAARLHGPLGRGGGNWAKLWFEQAAFPAYCRRERAHVAHVPYWAPPLFPATPTVVTIHDLIPLILPHYRGNLMVRLYTRLVSLSARRAACVITDSEASRRDIIARLRLRPERVQVVHLAADPAFRPITDSARLEKVRRRYGLPDRFLLYLGGFDRRKNVPLLLQAYAQALRREARTPDLVIAGRSPQEDTPFFPHPARTVQELSLGDRVRLIGPVDEDDKPALYSLARAFVFPSEYEGFGLPVLEALSCGTPAVVSDAGSLPEIVGEGGITVPAGDADRLGAALVDIARDGERRAALREKALVQASRFSWDRTAAQTAAIYARVRRC